MTSPIKKFNAGAIQVAIWENSAESNGENSLYKTVSIQKRYKDKQNQWKSSSSLKPNDVPKAVLALQKAYEYLSLKTETE
jgi:DNA-binding SARP family transcriptional activator